MISSCGTVPITERRQLKLLPESTINRQSARLYENVKNKAKLIHDKTRLAQIEKIGSRIQESVSAYFNSINQKDPTYNFQWEYILIDNEK